MTGRRISTWVLVAAIVGLTAALFAPASRAQNGGGLPGFFQNLFGGFSAKPPAPRQVETPLRSRSHKPHKRADDFLATTSTRAPGTPGGAPVTPTIFVSVMGDSLGLLTGQGLSAALANRPDISVSNLARDLSGLTRDDYFDWPKAAQRAASGNPRPDAVVVLLGINDVQPLKQNGETYDALSDKWREAYANRVDAMMTALRAAQIPVLWVGLPPMRDDRFNGQVTALNEIYRERADKMGAKYIDIWDAFADAEGKFAFFGADADGQNAKLRTGANGIYFTKAGARKIGELLATEIRRLVGKPATPGEIAALPPDLEQQADTINEQIRREMGVEGPSSNSPGPDALRPGRILSLGNHPSSPNGELILPISRSDSGSSDAERILQLGQLPPLRAGRADDFRWPRLN